VPLPPLIDARSGAGAAFLPYCKKFFRLDKIRSLTNGSLSGVTSMLAEDSTGQIIRDYKEVLVI
jgi:hypothetical protein